MLFEPPVWWKQHPNVAFFIIFLNKRFKLVLRGIQDFLVSARSHVLHVGFAWIRR